MMLSLNRATIHKSATITISATFDNVTKRGVVKNAESLIYENGKLTLNGKEHQMPWDFDFDYMDIVDLHEYFKQVTKHKQLDMFAEPVFKQVKYPRYIYPRPMLKDMPWEYLDANWRATDIAGSGAYFKSRPQLDKCGYWVSTVAGEMPIYGSHDYEPLDYNRSLQNLGAMR